MIKTHGYAALTARDALAPFQFERREPGRARVGLLVRRGRPRRAPGEHLVHGTGLRAPGEERRTRRLERRDG